MRRCIRRRVCSDSATGRAALWTRFDSTTQDALFAWAPAGWHVGAWPAWVAAWLPDDGWEALITTLNLFAALALASLTVRRHAPRVRLLLLFIVVALGVKAGATFLQSQSGLAFDWATPGALAGLGCGALLGLAALRLTRSARAGLAASALVVTLVFVNPAAGESLFRRRAGRLAARAVSALQRPRALARVGLAVRGAGVACVCRRTGVAGAAHSARLRAGRDACGGGGACPLAIIVCYGRSARGSRSSARQQLPPAATISEQNLAPPRRTRVLLHYCPSDSLPLRTSWIPSTSITSSFA